MKKMLFISPRNPFSDRFSGDVIRAKKFINFFGEQFDTTVISLEKFNSKKKIKKIKLVTFKEENKFSKFIYILKSFLKLKPFQLGYFYSKQINNYVMKNYEDFDLVFCQSVRVAQYVLPLKFKKKILDMGDLYSKNYYQSFDVKNALNPIKYVFLIESILMKKYEKLCLDNFHKTFLFSKKEIQSVKNKQNKVIKINFGVDKISKVFKYRKSNNRIIFIGNIRYMPNKLACEYFIKKILPKVLQINPQIEFHIIGEISSINKFFWKSNKSVKIHGKVKNLSPILKRSFCALANLNISTGIQTKILTYMSFGVPCIASRIVFNNFDNIKVQQLPFYKNDFELINLIFKAKNNRNYSEKASKKNLIYVKKFKWKRVLKDLSNL